MSRTRRVRANIALALFLVLLVLPAISGAAQTDLDGFQPANTFDPHANPVADLNQAIVEAEDTHRRILLDVGGEWCDWCKYLDEFFDSQPDLKALRDKNYVWVKINFSRENQNRQFLSNYPRIHDYPNIFVLDSGGHFYSSQEVKPFENGITFDAESIKAFLEKWAPPPEAAPAPPPPPFPRGKAEAFINREIARLQACPAVTKTTPAPVHVKVMWKAPSRLRLTSLTENLTTPGFFTATVEFAIDYQRSEFFNTDEEAQRANPSEFLWSTRHRHSYAVNASGAKLIDAEYFNDSDKQWEQDDPAPPFCWEPIN
jgi:hypothetical protein